ncbi:MAG: RDD family protein [Propionibacteriaceae bacterium]
MSNENWNDPGKPPSQPQPPSGQPSEPDPQAPPTAPEPEAPGTGSYSSPTYTTPSNTAPTYGTPGYSAPDTTPSSGTPAGGGYTAPASGQPYGSAPYGTPESTPPAYGSTPSYGTPAGSYGSAPEAGAGGYGQSQPGQYGATGYGQTGEGYQDPNAGYGTTPAPTYGAGYPSAGVSPYGYDSGYANPAPELASFGNRALGWLIDWVAPGFVAGILSSIVAGILNTSALGWLFSLLALAFTLWNSGYVAGTTGYSLGRRVAKNKLVSEATGQPIGVGPGLGRAAIDIVAMWLCVLPGVVNWLFPLWDSKKQTLADKVVKSVVVSDPNAGQTP